MDETLRAEVEEIVSDSDGDSIRERVRQAVEDAARRVEHAPDRLKELTAATIDAAARAIDRSTPSDPDSTLRQVIDGLGDGLSRTATATKLAVEEAAGDGRAYAEEELGRVGEDLRTLADMFVQIVERGVQGAAGETRHRLEHARGHAERTLASIRPALESAAEAAAKDPVGLAGESVGAASDLAREATGALFSAVGDLLSRAGDRIKPKDE